MAGGYEGMGGAWRLHCRLKLYPAIAKVSYMQTYFSANNVSED